MTFKIKFTIFFAPSLWFLRCLHPAVELPSEGDDEEERAPSPLPETVYHREFSLVAGLNMLLRSSRAVEKCFLTFSCYVLRKVGP